MNDKKLHRVLIILFLFVGIIFRMALLNWELPYYSVDENEVVEPALAFLSGDWEPHWYGYGPIFSYLLAFIYKVYMWTAAFTSGWTREDFFYAAFFEPTSFYVLGRGFHALIIIGIAVISWVFARRYFDSLTAAAALILGLSPLLDINTNFTIRIDTLLGLFSLLSLFFAAQFGQDRMQLRPYIMSGIFAGFGIATKNLTGFLVLPALVLAHFLSVWRTTNISAWKKVEYAVTRPHIWILMVSVLLGHTLANPYSVINFDGFLLELYNGYIKQSGGVKIFDYYESPYDFSWLVTKWGWPMVIAIALALLASVRRADNASRILLIYIAVFIIAFLPFKSQDYWYNAMFPAVIIIVASFISGVSQSIVKYLYNLRGKNSATIDHVTYANRLSFTVMIFLSIILIFSPYLKTGWLIHANWFSPVAPLEKRADSAAQAWIENNVPSRSSILMIGRHAYNLPRLLADKERVQAIWGEYFSYHRDEYLHWCEEYENAYLQLQQKNKPMYRIINIRERYSLTPHDLEMNSFYRNNMASIALDNDCKYVVIASPGGYKGAWEKNSKVTLLAYFNNSTGHSGDEVKIFKMLQ